MSFPDFYAVMGVSADASADDIKRAYRRLARKFHPDVSTEPNAEARFKALGEANDVLKDAERRAEYDRARARWQQAGRPNLPAGATWRDVARAGGPQGPAATHGAGGFGGGAGGFGGGAGGFGGGAGGFGGGAGGFGGGAEQLDPAEVEALFEQLFRGFGGTGRASGGADAGAPLEVEMTLNLEEAYAGCRRTLRLAVPEYGADGRISTVDRSISVALPPGARDGEKVRVKAASVAAPLRVIVRHAPHPEFSTNGRDVLASLAIAPWEAATGASVDVPTLGGKVRMQLPASAAHGARLRLRGRGLPAGGRGKPGDQFVSLRIVTPAADSDALRAAYDTLGREAASAGWHPREAVSA